MPSPGQIAFDSLTKEQSDIIDLFALLGKLALKHSNTDNSRLAYYAAATTVLEAMIYHILLHDSKTLEDRLALVEPYVNRTAEGLIENLKASLLAGKLHSY